MSKAPTVLVAALVALTVLTGGFAGVAAADDADADDENVIEVEFDTDDDELTTDGVVIDDITENESQLEVVFEFEELNESGVEDGDSENVTVEIPVVDADNVEIEESLEFDADADENDTQSVTFDDVLADVDADDWDDTEGVMLTTETVDAHHVIISEADDDGVLGGGVGDTDIDVVEVIVIVAAGITILAFIGSRTSN